MGGDLSIVFLLLPPSLSRQLERSSTEKHRQHVPFFGGVPYKSVLRYLAGAPAVGAAGGDVTRRRHVGFAWREELPAGRGSILGESVWVTVQWPVGTHHFPSYSLKALV